MGHLARPRNFVPETRARERARDVRNGTGCAVAEEDGRCAARSALCVSANDGTSDGVPTLSTRTVALNESLVSRRWLHEI